MENSGYNLSLAKSWSSIWTLRVLY